jgi:hypothetical protein
MLQGVLRISITLAGMTFGPVVGCLTAGSNVETKFGHFMDGKVRFYILEGTNDVWVSLSVPSTDNEEGLQGDYCVMA